jgi:hypothetical protein
MALCCMCPGVTNISFMETALTIPLRGKKSEAVKATDRELRHGFHFDRVRKLAGSVDSSPKHSQMDRWRRHIRQRNWR